MKIILGLFLCLVFVVNGFGQNFLTAQTCKLSGKVLDVLVNEAVVPGVNITFSNQNIRKTVASDDLGKYEVLLPSGIYNISLTRPIVSPSFDRSKLNLNCSDEMIINFYPYPEKSLKNPVYKYAYLSKPWIDNAMSIAVAYFSKKRNKQLTTYEDAMLTFDKYTIFAGQLIQDDKRKLIIAKNGWIENGKKREKFDKTILGFDSNVIKIDPIIANKTLN